MRSLFICLLLVTILNKSTAQKSIIKSKCNCTNKGYRLTLYDYSHDKYFKNVNCKLSQIIRDFSNLQDTIKQRIIDSLLSFKHDSSVTCFEVKRYASTDASAPESKTYSIQIEALYIINWLMFYNYARSLCPYPVLYDNVQKKEVNIDQLAIQEVFEIYAKWYQNLKHNNYSNYQFPLLNTKYEWYGGTKLTLKMSIPGNSIPAIAD